MPTQHEFKSIYNVYFSDTDTAGVVYYANYLRYCEHARADMFKQMKLSQLALKDDYETGFIVKHVDMDLHSSLRLEDELEVTTVIKEIKGPRLHLLQTIKKIGSVHDTTTTAVEMACVNTNTMRPRRVPEPLLAVLREYV